MERTKYLAPVLLIVLGITWLLNTLHILPGVDWIWTVGLAAVGILTLAIGKMNKLTIVVGPFLIVCATCSLLGKPDTWNSTLRHLYWFLP